MLFISQKDISKMCAQLKLTQVMLMTVGIKRRLKKLFKNGNGPRNDLLWSGSSLEWEVGFSLRKIS